MQKVNGAASSWTAGVNRRFHSLTLGEVKTLMGALPESAEMKADPRYCVQYNTVCVRLYFLVCVRHPGESLACVFVFACLFASLDQGRIPTFIDYE